MISGHIYILDLQTVHPSYVAALQEFLNLFGEGYGWAKEVTELGFLKIAIKNGKLDSDLHSKFLPRTKGIEVRQSAHETVLSFPNHPFLSALEAVRPGDVPREEGEDMTEVDAGKIEELRHKIDEAHGRA